MLHKFLAFLDLWLLVYTQQVSCITGCLQAKRDREAAAAEDGWTVVVNKGGRKKNTDESGISVGAVDVTAATERAKKKQRKEGILDFYRFQRREARRNGITAENSVSASMLCLHLRLPAQFTFCSFIFSSGQSY